MATPNAVGVDETFLDIHGTRVFCQRKGRGEPLLVLHGEDGASQWRPLYDRLAERFDVMAPDHPGFGRSELPHWLESIRDLVYHYLDVLEALGLDQVHIMGEGFGGWLAAELAVGHDDRLRKLVLIDPFGIKPRELQLPDLFAMNREQLAATTFQDPRLAGEYAGQQPPREELERQLQDKATLSRIGWNPYLHNPQLPQWLHRVRAPTLLVWGRQDQLIPPEAAQLWLEGLPNARLVVIEEAGHLPQVERTDEVFRAVGDFLTQQVEA